MSKHDDNFKNVGHGLPPVRKSTQGFNFVMLFILVGIALAFAIYTFSSVIFETGSQLKKSGLGYIPSQALMNGILALAVGSVQAWIFKSRIKSRIPLFVGFAALGGVIGGLFGGILINSGINTPFIIGAINGGIAGATSSTIQNRIMGNSRYGTNWLTYSSISWLIVFAIGWAIGWEPSTSNLALASVFMLIGSGIGLWIFLNNTPQIEFD
jgi:uncharacterized membrane protein YuzA (DUF378 family)